MFAPRQATSWPDCLFAHWHSHNVAGPDAADPDSALGDERHSGRQSVSGAIIPGGASGRATLGSSAGVVGIPSGVSVGAAIDGVRSSHGLYGIARVGTGLGGGVWSGTRADCPVGQSADCGD